MSPALRLLSFWEQLDPNAVAAAAAAAINHGWSLVLDASFGWLCLFIGGLLIAVPGA